MTSQTVKAQRNKHFFRNLLFNNLENYKTTGRIGFHLQLVILYYAIFVKKSERAIIKAIDLENVSAADFQETEQCNRICLAGIGSQDNITNRHRTSL